MKDNAAKGSPLKNTEQLRDKLLILWGKFEEGKLSVLDARIHIGFARATLDSLKVEIAQAHLDESNPLLPVTFQRQPVNDRKTNG